MRCTCREAGCLGEARPGFKSCAVCADARAARARRRYRALPIASPGPSTRMREGRGERRPDCARYAECLDEFIRARPREDPPAFCPRGCYQPAEMPRADAYRSLNGEARGA